MIILSLKIEENLIIENRITTPNNDRRILILCYQYRAHLHLYGIYICHADRHVLQETQV